MSYELLVLPSAEREPRRLQRKELWKIVRCIEGLAGRPRPHGVQKLRGSKDRYRVRQGRYRILYRIDDKTKRVIGYSVADRKYVYR